MVRERECIDANGKDWCDFRDTAGQRNFRTIGRGYYTSTKAFVLVYDVTDLETFRLIEHFSRSIELVRSNVLYFPR